MTSIQILPFDEIRVRILPYLAGSEASFPYGYEHSPTITNTFPLQIYGENIMYEIPISFEECKELYILLHKLYDGLNIGLTYRCFAEPYKIRIQKTQIFNHSYLCKKYLEENNILIPIIE